MPRKTAQTVVIASALTLAFSACGTRASGGGSDRVAHVQPGARPVQASSGSDAPNPTGAAAASAAAEQGAEASVVSRVPNPGVSAQIPAPAGPLFPGANSPSLRKGTTTPEAPTADRSTSNPTAAPGAPPIPSGVAKDTSPIVIGSIGTMSGPAGDVVKRTYEGLQLWVAAVNARGGIDGHPVKSIGADDGGDPARYKAELQRLVERENVVAVVANPDAINGHTGVDYIRDKKVPYVGGDGGGDWYYTTPFHFPQETMGVTIAEAEIRDVGVYGRARAKNKLGTLTCVEGDICTILDRVWNEKARSYGLEPVYRGRASIVQPDYTAECLAAQRAGVELFEVALDSNSITRLAAACARQGFRPLFGFVAGIARHNMEDDPNLEGARATVPTFSWLQNDSPATAEFQEAVKRYGRGMQPTAGHTGGWTAGKLFEKGVLAGGATGKVTRESTLAGLYTMKNDTLGGLTGPLTFTAGQDAPRTRCTSGIEISGGKWRVMNDGKFICE